MCLRSRDRDREHEDREHENLSEDSFVMDDEY